MLYIIPWSINYKASYETYYYHWTNFGYFDSFEEGFRNIVQGGIDEGAFQEVDRKIASLTILSSLNWVVEWYKKEGQLNPEEIADGLTKFILRGLKKELPASYGMVTE